MELIKLTMEYLTYDEDLRYCSICEEKFKNGEKIRKCPECDEFFHYYPCNKQHTLLKHSPHYNEYTYGEEELPIEHETTWVIWRLSGEEIYRTAQMMFLQPNKVEGYLYVIARRVKAKFEAIQVNYTEVLEESIIAEYPKWKEESEINKRFLEMFDSIFKVF